MATIGIIPAATGRMGFIPLFNLHGAHTLRLVWAYSYVFLLPIAAYDFWSRRRLHTATIWESIFLIALHRGAIAIAYTAPWNAFAGWLQSSNLWRNEKPVRGRAANRRMVQEWVKLSS